jgi:hypothetical protein
MGSDFLLFYILEIYWYQLVNGYGTLMGYLISSNSLRCDVADFRKAVQSYSGHRRAHSISQQVSGQLMRASKLWKRMHLLLVLGISSPNGMTHVPLRKRT